MVLHVIAAYVCALSVSASWAVTNSLCSSSQRRAFRGPFAVPSGLACDAGVSSVQEGTLLPHDGLAFAWHHWKLP